MLSARCYKRTSEIRESGALRSVSSVNSKRLQSFFVGMVYPFSLGVRAGRLREDLAAVSFAP
jgi:hypothetical protein